MPNKKSAEKELRKAEKRQVANDFVRKQLKELTKTTKKAIAAKQPEAKESLSKAAQALDKAAKKGVIKKNAASRKKSRLTKALNKASK